MLLLDCGLRITEALTLERARVDLERRCVTVYGKGSRERIVPLSVEGRTALFLWLSRTKGRHVFCIVYVGYLRYGLRGYTDVVSDVLFQIGQLFVCFGRLLDPLDGRVQIVVKRSHECWVNA